MCMRRVDVNTELSRLPLRDNLVNSEVNISVCLGYSCILKCAYVSKFILRPNLAYNWTFNCDISSLMVLNFSSTTAVSSSIFVVDVDNSSWTSGKGNEMKESPILYLTNGKRVL